MATRYGRPGVGKSALTYYTIQEVHRRGRNAAYINLESYTSSQIQWMQKMCPDIKADQLMWVDPVANEESVAMFLTALDSGEFDVIVFDALGALSTGNELKIGNSKQAYGQSAMITQLAKQTLMLANKHQTVVIFVNHIRDKSVQFGASLVIQEKAPGGHAKEHLSVMRVNLRPIGKKETKVVVTDSYGQDVQIMGRVLAKIERNKVGYPNVNTAWNFWNQPSPEGLVGIDVLQDVIDTSLQRGKIERGGKYYKNDLFPGGRIDGKDETRQWLAEHPEVVASLRRELVMEEYEKSTVKELIANESE